MKKIRLVSRILQRVFLFMLIALPLCSIVFWFFVNIPNSLGIKTSFIPGVSSDVLQPDFPSRLVGFLVNMIPLSIEMFCLYALIKLFKLYEQGKIFTLKNVKYIRYIALALIAQEAVKPFNQIITSYIMTFNNPPGHRVIAVSFGNEDLRNIVIGVVILLASWIMAEASKLHDEQSLTI